MRPQRLRIRVVDDRSSRRPSPGRTAFVLSELEWMRERLLSRLTCDRLATFVHDAQTGTGTLSEQELRTVIATVDDAEELLISIGFGLSGIPFQDVHASADDIADAAANALADGIADGERALHAANWLAPARGLRALASNLRDNDAHVIWNVRPAQFLTAFRHAGTLDARSVIEDPRVAEAPFSALTPEQIAALADDLERAAHALDATD
jgi:hypothetical protein